MKVYEWFADSDTVDYSHLLIGNDYNISHSNERASGNFQGRMGC